MLGFRFSENVEQFYELYNQVKAGCKRMRGDNGIFLPRSISTIFLVAIYSECFTDFFFYYLLDNWIIFSKNKCDQKRLFREHFKYSNTASGNFIQKRALVSARYSGLNGYQKQLYKCGAITAAGEKGINSDFTSRDRFINQ